MNKCMVTRHFDFYCEPIEETAADMSRALESNFERIIKDLKVTIRHRVKVYIYPDLKSFHQAIKAPDAPDWVVGGAWKNKLMIVSPNAPGLPHNYDGMIKVAVHELTHIAIWSINPHTGRIPTWLNEGLALYEAQQITDEQLNHLRNTTEIPHLNDLQKEFLSFGQKNGYLYSFSIVQFIMNRYGLEALIALIKGPGKLQKVLGIDENHFESEWKNSMLNGDRT